MTSYKEEFPTFGEMDIEIPDGFEDMSWKNDSCPSFGNKALGLVLFVDYVDPDRREFSGTPRFGLRSVSIGEDGDIAYGPDDEDLLATDDFAAIVTEIDSRRSHQPNKPDPIKPSIPDVVEQFAAYLDMPGNGAGGSLHAVLEDGNVSDKDVRNAIDLALQAQDEAGVELGRILLEMSKTQRTKLPSAVASFRAANGGSPRFR